MTDLRRVRRHRRVRTLVLLSMIATASVPVAAQSVVWVDDSNCVPGPGTGTQADPYCRIQDAICNHRNDAGGVTVRVLPGTYNEAIRMFPYVDLVLTDGPKVTVIDASNPTVEACYTSYGWLMTPVLILDGKVAFMGYVPEKDDINAGMRMASGSKS